MHPCLIPLWVASSIWRVEEGSEIGTESHPYQQIDDADAAFVGPFPQQKSYVDLDPALYSESAVKVAGS